MCPGRKGTLVLEFVHIVVFIWKNIEKITKNREKILTDKRKVSKISLAKPL